MPSMQRLQQIVLASDNAGKIAEIQAILPSQQIIAQGKFNATSAAETGTTFVENAILKAKHAAAFCALPVIADDSGLVVSALDGAPGVISSRYAGNNATDSQNLQKLLDRMQAIPAGQRSAQFVCVMVFMNGPNDPLPIITQAVWEGVILDRAIGNNGFGYDPIFWLPDLQQTSAQLSPSTKNELSHRGQSLRKLAGLLGIK